MKTTTHFRALKWTFAVFTLCLFVLLGTNAYTQGNGNPPTDLFGGPLEQVATGPQGIAARAGEISAVGISAASDTIDVALPDGNQVTLVRDGFERRGAGNVTWRGRVATDSDSRAVLTLRRGYVVGRIRIGLDVYEIRPERGSRHVIERLDPALFPPEISIPAETLPDSVPDGSAGPETPGGDANPSADSPDEIHIMVTYSPQARAGAGGTAQIEAEIQFAVDGTNTAFGDSDMIPRLVLVHTEELSRNDSNDIQADLYWLKDDPGVGALRDQHGADMVAHLAGSDPNYCGIGFVQRSPGASFAPWAFSVTLRTCINNLSFAHELGHNMGFEHNSENSSATSSTASYPWSFGHYDINANFRTVMSYSNPCPGCPRQYNFSNPDIYYSGSPMGVANEHDNARTGDLTAQGVADFRAAVTPPPTSGPIKFAVIGDYGDGSAAELAVANLVAGENPDFVITAGDNRYGGNSFTSAVGEYYCNFLSGVAGEAPCLSGNSVTNAFFPSPGNHDYNDGGGIGEYLAYFDLPGAGVSTSNTSGSELYYDFVQGPVHFFVIDSDGAKDLTASTEIAQQAWLQAALAASTTPWQVVYLHHAPYSSSSSHGSDPDMQWPFATWGADAVIAGHDHTYERLEVDAIPYFVNGLGGRSVYSFGTPISESVFRYNGTGDGNDDDGYGAMIVDASDASMTFQFISISDGIVETYTIPDTNTDPSFTSDPIVESDATEGAAYNGSISDDANDPDTDPLTFSSLGGPAWLTVASDGGLSGTPGVGDIGLNSWTVEVDDGNGGTDTSTLEITVVEPSPYVDQLAVGSSTTWGSVAGSFSDTHANDGSLQSITEVRSGGKPSNRYSRARFDWLFDIVPGTSVTLFANAWASESSDGDLYRISYSTDGSSYTELFLINKTVDDNAYMVGALPNNISGTVYVRVEDTDSTPGHLDYDTVNVDHLYIRTDNLPPGPPPAAPHTLGATAASSSTINLTWFDNSFDELGFYLERTTTPGSENSWARIGTTGPNATAYIDSGLAPSTTYSYRVQAFNSGGASAYSAPASDTTEGAPTLSPIHIEDLSATTSGKKRWTSVLTILVMDEENTAVSEAAVSGTWSDGGTWNCVTTGNGRCEVSKAHKNNVNSVTAAVTGVTHPTRSYDPAANVEWTIDIPHP